MLSEEVIKKLRNSGLFQVQNYLLTLERLDPNSFKTEIAQIQEIVKEKEEIERLRQEALQRQWEAERQRKIRATEEAARKFREDPNNAAAEVGWNAMREIVPTLDGVEKFWDLPDALKYRYGAFARAVLKAGMDRKNVVLSSKQETGETPLPVWMQENE